MKTPPNRLNPSQKPTSLHGSKATGFQIQSFCSAKERHMLYLDKPIGPIQGMMIYADHANPNLFYYVPERPRLARNDGTPEFVYLKYRRDITDNPAFDPDTKQS